MFSPMETHCISHTELMKSENLKRETRRGWPINHLGSFP